MVGKAPVRCAVVQRSVFIFPVCIVLPSCAPEQSGSFLRSPAATVAVRRLKEVVYHLGTYNQKVMSGLWADMPYKITKKVKENWLTNLCFFVPVVGTYQCVGAHYQPASPEPPLLLTCRLRASIRFCCETLSVAVSACSREPRGTLL